MTENVDFHSNSIGILYSKLSKLRITEKRCTAFWTNYFFLPPGTILGSSPLYLIFVVTKEPKRKRKCTVHILLPNANRLFISLTEPKNHKKMLPMRWFHSLKRCIKTVYQTTKTVLQRPRVNAFWIERFSHLLFRCCGRVICNGLRYFTPMISVSIGCCLVFDSERVLLWFPQLQTTDGKVSRFSPWLFKPRVVVCAAL